jgi:hypothetical protein
MKSFTKKLRDAMEARELRLFHIYASMEGGLDDFVARGTRDQTRLLVRLPDGRLAIRDAFDSGVIRSSDKEIVEASAEEWNNRDGIIADEFLETVPFRDVVQAYVDATVQAQSALIDREDPRDP